MPPHVFGIDGEALWHVAFERDGDRFALVDHARVELAEDTFHDGPLGGPVRNLGALGDALSGLLADLRAPIDSASLVLPDAWMRVSFAEVGELPSDPSGREEALRWKLKRLVPYRVDELRLRDVAVAPLPDQDDPGRVLLGFALETLLRQLEELFLEHKVRIGQISNASLSLLSALEFAAGDAELVGYCLVDEDGYAMVFVRRGEPVLHRFKGLAGVKSASAYEHLVSRDLRLTRLFLDQHLGAGSLERVLLVAPVEAEAWWLQALETGLGVEPLAVTWQLLPLAGELPAMPWERIAPMFGAASRRVA